MFWYESQLYSIDRVARIGGSEGKEEGGARKRATRAMTMTMTRKFLGWSTRASQSGHPDPIMKKKSRTEAFSQVYVCAQNPVHTCSHAAVCCSAGGFFLALLTNGQWTAKNFRGTRRANSPRLFYPPRGGDRDRVRILARIHRVSPPPLLFSADQRRDTLARWSIWEILTRAIMPTYPDVRYWNLYRTVLCIWKFVEQVWSGVSSAFKGNAWFSIEVTVTYPFAGFYNTRV